MKQETVELLKNKLISLSQQLASHQSNDVEIFIYDDKSNDMVFIDYKNIKDKIKSMITNDNFLADRHKISAFFMSAIIKNKPIKIKLNKTDMIDDDLELIININLALLFTNYIITSFYKLKTKKDIKIVYPKTDKNNYIDQLSGLIMMLRDKIEQNDKEILLMAISHIIFLIENYSILHSNK